MLLQLVISLIAIEELKTNSLIKDEGDVMHLLLCILIGCLLNQSEEEYGHCYVCFS